MLHESEIEKTLIDIVTQRANQWTYRNDIKSEAALWDNLRGHINRINLLELNGEQLTDTEFERVKIEIRRHTQTPFAASQWLRGENGVAKIVIDRDDSSKDRSNLILFSNKEIGGGISSYEVVSQVVPQLADGQRQTRGDVTLLINGLPIIHIELKAEYAKDGYWQAFDQIERYAQAGFFDGIFSTVQIFVVSNKISTKYFARPSSNTGFSFAKKFLFNWREPNNKPVEDLYDFAQKVLRIPEAHRLVSRYTILVDDKKGQRYLMVLRPYQIHAIEKIHNQACAHTGGFIWHATGSGKTITSFVATKLLAQNATGVARTVMIVDRKDLDSQTKDEFGKFASEYSTGLSSGDVADNTLIVGIDNKRELVTHFLNKKNSNTVIVTTIQKLSRAIRECKETDSNSFEKLKGDHIVFIVDECHRAVSDKEMREIKKFFPRSTWFGLTGTPIFDENKKTEMGTYARTTKDQYGELLHAYTTKNAMDDRSVLDFQVEYHSLMSAEDEQRLYLHKAKEKYPHEDAAAKLNAMSVLEKEALLDNTDFENDAYIEAMLLKIFRQQNVLEKFKVVDGVPTMSGILTTHSIAQAKRIYRKLMVMKKAGTLITGKPLDERRRLNDPDFPRVAITYSISESQDGKNKAQEELLEIMREYDATFGTHYADGATRVKKNAENGETDIDDSNYNHNINNRLARKGVQYQQNGQWLDLVIVVERMLTGFDAPTVQTLYVDKELKWHGLLQAFSRTNRNAPGKTIGMIVTFRKPETMRSNVRDAIRLFSNEARDWERLVPKQYKEVKQSIKAAYKAFAAAQKEWVKDPNDLKKRMDVIKAYQSLKHQGDAIKSYEEFEEDYSSLSHITKTITAEVGTIENLKAEVRKELEDQNLGDDYMDEALQIEFVSDGRPTQIDRIDSYYIAQLLKDIHNESSRRKFDELIKNKPSIVKEAYAEVLNSTADDVEVIRRVDSYFRRIIDKIIHEAETLLAVPAEDLRISLNEYSHAKGEVPYINVIIDKCALHKEDFERVFNKKYRERSRVIEEYWKKTIEEKLLPLRDELVNFASELKTIWGEEGV